MSLLESYALQRPQEKALMNSPLLVAVEENRPEAVSALLQSNKYTLVTLINALSSAFGNSRLECVKLIFKHTQVDLLSAHSGELAQEAIMSDARPTLDLALELSILSKDERLREYATIHDKSISLQFLLSGDEPGPYLYLAAAHNARLALTFILSDGRTTQEQVREGIREATKRLLHSKDSTSALQSLVSDSRISPFIKQVIYEEWTNAHSQRDFLLVVATTQGLDLSSLDPRITSEILTLRDESIIQTGKWSGITSASLRESIESPNSDLDYLLREIIVKRQAPEYYLNWLLARASKNKEKDLSPSPCCEPESRELHQVLSSAARSLLSSEEVIHTTDESTAYSGFLLFMLTDTSKSSATQVLSILERGKASHGGVQLASVLIGASIEIVVEIDT